MHNRGQAAQAGRRWLCLRYGGRRGCRFAVCLRGRRGRVPGVLTLAAFHEHCKLKNFNRIPRLTFHFVKMLKFKQMLNVWDGSKGVVKHNPAGGDFAL